MQIIRKISIGSDLKSAIHYQVNGKSFKGSLVSDIIFEDGFYKIFINIDEEDKDCKVLWKSFNQSIVSHIEYVTDEL
jgi:uncharacterized protein YciU (UPF0263 family)